MEIKEGGIKVLSPGNDIIKKAKITGKKVLTKAIRVKWSSWRLNIHFFVFPEVLAFFFSRAFSRL